MVKPGGRSPEGFTNMVDFYGRVLNNLETDDNHRAGTKDKEGQRKTVHIQNPAQVLEHAKREIRAPRFFLRFQLMMLRLLGGKPDHETLRSLRISR